MIKARLESGKGRTKEDLANARTFSVQIKRAETGWISTLASLKAEREAMAKELPKNVMAELGGLSLTASECNLDCAATFNRITEEIAAKHRVAVTIQCKSRSIYIAA